MKMHTGLRLLSAMQGRDGLELARPHHPGLVLLDLNLPDITGNEVLRLLRENAHTREIPVVIVSTDATAHQIQRLTEGAAQAYLSKPLDVQQFFNVLNAVLPQFSAPSLQPLAAALVPGALAPTSTP